MSTARLGPDASWAALRASIDGRLVGPDDAGYDSARLLFNRRFDDVVRRRSPTSPVRPTWWSAWRSRAGRGSGER